MKTAEEFLQEAIDSHPVLFKDGEIVAKNPIIHAMDLYAQECRASDKARIAELEKELKAIVSMDNTRPDNFDPLKHTAWHCVRQFMELSVDKKINYFIVNGIASGENLTMRKLLVRAAPFIKATNPPVYDSKGIAERDALITEIDQLNKALEKELAELKKAAIDVANEAMTTQELGFRYRDKCNTQEVEITALKSLLAKCRPLIIHVANDEVELEERKKLLSEIDQLNK